MPSARWLADATAEDAGVAGRLSGAVVAEAREGGAEEGVPGCKGEAGVGGEGRAEQGGAGMRGEGANSGVLWAARLSGVDLSADGGQGGAGRGGTAFSKMYDLYVEFSVQESDFGGGTSPALF